MSAFSYLCRCGVCLFQAKRSYLDFVDVADDDVLFYLITDRNNPALLYIWNFALLELLLLILVYKGIKLTIYVYLAHNCIIM